MKRLSFLFIFVGFFPQIAAASPPVQDSGVAGAAQVYISEIMYDPAGSDTGHEWVEVCGDATADLANWKFNEANTNHALSQVQGGTNVSAGGCAVIADDAPKFLVDHPGFSGVLFDSSFSLGNTGETLALKDGALNIIDSVSYSSASGATGDGNSLQKINGAWSAATPTPGVANISNSTNLEAEPPSGGGSSVWPEYVPPEKAPKIKMEIVAEARAIAGAAQRFEARVYGTNNAPITNARVIWNFGDGARGEGRFAAHAFNYPGTYFVVADASSGEYVATARLTINVEGNTLYVSEVNPGATTTAWIEIANPGANAVGLTGWFLESAGGNFIFPDNSILAPRSFVVFTSENTKLDISAAGEVKLLYPNGKPADTFIYSGELGDGKTFQRAGEKIMAAKATPGAASAIVLAVNNARAVGVPARPAPAETVSVPESDSTIEQAANVRDSVTHNGDGWWLWLIASAGLGIFGAAAFLFTKHQAQKEAPAISKEAEEFKIEEI